MLVRVSPDLGRLQILAETLEQETILGYRHGSPEPVEVVTFDDPVLITDNARTAALESGLRDTVFSLYQSYPRTVSYQGVSVSWSPTKYPRVWCPSIDTLFFARALDKELDGVQSLAELGTGSGFLAKFALVRGQSLGRAVATDISPEAIRCAHDATSDLGGFRSLNLALTRADAPDFGVDGRYDLIISNPPYIPRPSERNDNPYEGLDLVAKISRLGRDHLTDNGRVLLNISSLSGSAPFEWFDRDGWTITPLDELRVPLKVNPVTSGASPESTAWLGYLRERGTLEDDGEGAPYRWWHRLQMIALSR